MSNALLLLDIVLGSLNVVAKAQALLLQAQTEGRDVTDDELQTLRDENRAKRAEWDNS